MKKIFLLLLIIILSLSLFNGCSPANSPGFTPAEGEGEGEPTGDRVVLVELFNTEGCAASALINPIAEDLAQQYGTGQVILLEEAGWGVYSTIETTERFDWYVPGTKHTPFIAFNGLSETFSEGVSGGGGGGSSTPAITTYVLTTAVSPAGGGTTSPAAGAHTYAAGTVVGISATPASGYHFVSWSVSTGAAVAAPGSASTTVVVDANKTVTANFELNAVTYTLTTAVSPAGGGTTSPAAGVHNYSAGTVVGITATPASGYHFVNWTGSVANPNSTSTTVTMDANKTVTANFEEDGTISQSIVICADTQHGSARYTVRDEINNLNPMAVFIAGDLVQDPNSTSEWKDFFDNVVVDYNQLYTACGNWDVGGYLTYFDDLWYSVDLSLNGKTIHFIILDSNSAVGVGSTQYNWLEDDLSFNSSADFTIAIFHHPPYSTGGHHTIDEMGLRGTIVPLLESNDVDIVFSGHDHDFEKCRHNSHYYIVTGGAGATLVTQTRSPDGFESLSFNSMHHFCKLFINGSNQLEVEVYEVPDNGSGATLFVDGGFTIP